MQIKYPQFLFAILLVLLPGLANAQDTGIPYWASLNAETVNMRVGPSTTYPIAWIYSREGLPVKVIRVNEGWRLVEDPDGVQGWMAARLLTRARTAIISGEGNASMRAAPESSAPLRWHVEPGVVGKLGACRDGFCEFLVQGHKGWVEQSRLWGAEEL